MGLILVRSDGKVEIYGSPFSHRTREFCSMLRISCIVFSIGLIALSGCPSKVADRSKAGATSSSNVEKPPLRVFLVGEKSVGEALVRRWQGTSQQLLEVVSIDEKGLLQEKEIRADVIIFPSRCLGEMVERKWISPLPSKLVEGRTSASANPDLIWPEVWRKQVSYGKKLWGVPLGVCIPMVLCHSKLGGGQSVWKLDSLLANDAIPQEKKNASSESPDAIDTDALIDRYTLMLATELNVSPNMGLYFQLSNLKPRLTEPAFLRVAEKMAKAASSSKADWLGSHGLAWRGVREGSSPWGIGLPDRRNPGNTIEASEPLQVGRFFNEGLAGGVSNIDGGSGLVASLSRSSRQSTAASYLLEWLDQSEQREMLSRETPWADARLGDGISATSPDQGNYDRARRAVLLQGELLSELRLRGGRAYRDRLGAALARIVMEGKEIEQRLTECRQEWEKITEELGREAQQKSLERTLQLLEADAL